MIRTPLAGAAFALFVSNAVAAPVPEGVWSTPGGKAQIRIAACAGGICATLVGLKKPNDKRGRAKVDKHNPDEARRDRPVIGMSLANGMAPDGDGWKGAVYNPDDGRTYVGRIEVASADTLRLRGCALKVLCRTQVLTRVS